MTQPAGAPLNAIHDRAPVVIWDEDRNRWLSVKGAVSDLIMAQNPDRFDVRPISEAEIFAKTNA